MIDSESSQEAVPPQSSQRSDAFARLYDFFKHLTGLVLVSIGGVLGLLKGGDPAISPVAFGLVIGSLSLAGVVAVTTLAQLASMGFTGGDTATKLKRSALIAQNICVVCLLFGLGVFMGVFVIGFIG